MKVRDLIAGLATEDPEAIVCLGVVRGASGFDVQALEQRLAGGKPVVVLSGHRTSVLLDPVERSDGA